MKRLTRADATDVTNMTNRSNTSNGSDRSNTLNRGESIIYEMAIDLSIKLYREATISSLSNLIILLLNAIMSKRKLKQPPTPFLNDMFDIILLHCKTPKNTLYPAYIQGALDLLDSVGDTHGTRHGRQLDILLGAYSLLSYCKDLFNYSKPIPPNPLLQYCEPYQ